jgi:hypothetical protein
MVAHWIGAGGHPGRVRNLAINGVGALAIAVTLVVVLVAKFGEGAWVTVLLIPAMLAVFGAVRRHYRSVALEIMNAAPLDVTNIQPPIVVLPLSAWTKMSQKGLRFALKLSPDIFAVQVDDLTNHWNDYVERPAMRAGLAIPQLVTIESPYRHVFNPLLVYILEMKRQHPDRQIAVLIPELVARHWYHHLLHNKRAAMLKALLLVRGDEDIVVINVPWYLSG